MFVMSAAAFDALIACFDAKFNYWFIRPPQANTGIVTVFPTPQHPSYPSAHSCFSGAYSGVLAAAFPSERARVAAVAQEASLSRLYAGIHYRFDMEAGQHERSEEHTSELQSRLHLVCRLLLEKKKNKDTT